MTASDRERIVEDAGEYAAQVLERRSELADTATTKTEKTRKTPRRPSIGALMAATEEQRKSMTDIMGQFRKLPDELRVIVASQVRQEMGQ